MERVREIGLAMWRRYRSWRGWVQVLVALFVLSLAVSPFTSEDEDAEQVAQRGTTTTERVATTTERVAAPAGPFTLSVAGEPSGGQLVVRGTTNLPDGALITLLVGRNVRYESQEEDRLHNVGGTGVRVQSGAFSATLTPSEHRLLAFLEDYMRTRSPGGLGRIDTLSDSVVVCAQFRTGEDEGKSIQPPAVVEAVGPRGERLSDSPQKSVRGSATAEPENWLQAIAVVMR